MTVLEKKGVQSLTKDYSKFLVENENKTESATTVSESRRQSVSHTVFNVCLDVWTQILLFANDLKLILDFRFKTNFKEPKYLQQDRLIIFRQ